ncbi:hypothetical protein J056_003934 [Wallemia ichthyophaga EXF-994]|uniref:Thioredoxin domain-containing protein n=1 Tax=Wallemia ichthyophaga (strain EXF-994 / CBS 113033) TaxID=1299270 RepID=R9AHN6_WALI9|nr:uncharacterized protein J056_003934 [Wallemia ichthyophaga EXF-994]EOR01698.1 hypothetical protein J056_003934 [Wallemia ichthyophaga EXF-994]
MLNVSEYDKNKVFSVNDINEYAQLICYTQNPVFVMFKSENHDADISNFFAEVVEKLADETKDVTFISVNYVYRKRLEEPVPGSNLICAYENTRWLPCFRIYQNGQRRGSLCHFMGSKLEFEKMELDTKTLVAAAKNMVGDDEAAIDKYPLLLPDNPKDRESKEGLFII